MNVKIYNTLGQENGTLKLNDNVFNQEYNEPLIHQVVVAYLSNQRQGTKSTLTRSEVRGHAKKPWRQKGTGRARHGSTKGPQWRGGGVVFAPKPRDFSKKVNKTAKISAFKSAISEKMRNKEVIVLDKLAVENGKTKEFIAILNNLKLNDSVIFVDTKIDELVMRSAGNVYNVRLTASDLLNVYDLVRNSKVVITVDAIRKIEEVYA